MNKLYQLIIRVIVTTAIVYFFLKLLLSPNEETNKVIGNLFSFPSTGYDFFYIFLSFIIGYAHYEFFSKYYNKFIWDDIAKNIIIFVYSKTEPAKSYVKYDHAAMQRFYKAVDNDNSLTAKSQVIMLNGIVISALFDLIFYSLLHMLLQGGLSYFSNIKERLTIGLFFLLLTVPIFFFALYFRKRHKRLSQEQLDYINEHKIQL